MMLQGDGRDGSREGCALLTTDTVQRMTSRRGEGQHLRKVVGGGSGDRDAESWGGGVGTGVAVFKAGMLSSGETKPALVKSANASAVGADVLKELLMGSY